MVEVYKPTDLSEALAIIAETDALIFAGGSDLMVKYRKWSGLLPDLPKTTVLIGQLDDLKGIHYENETLVIRSATTLSEILGSPVVPDYIKMVIQEIGSESIRNLGTIGGNICNGSPAGDTLPFLYALDAVLTLQSSTSSRTVSIAGFITGPGKTILRPDELLVSVSMKLPPSPFNKFMIRKIGQRKGNAISKVSFFGLADSDAQNVYDVRIALGSVAPTVVRSLSFEKMIVDTKKENLNMLVPAMEQIYSTLIRPIDDVRSTKVYRSHVSLTLLKKFLLGGL